MKPTVYVSAPDDALLGDVAGTLTRLYGVSIVLHWSQVDDVDGMVLVGPPTPEWERAKQLGLATFHWPEASPRLMAWAMTHPADL